MRAPSWIDALWQRLLKFIQQVFGPKTAAIGAGPELGKPLVLPAQSPPQQSLVAASVVAESAAAQSSVVAEPSVVAKPVVVAEPVVVAQSLVVAEPEPVAQSVVVAVPAQSVVASGLRAGAQPALSVRRYFGRLVSATPAGLTIDFTRWQAASVERYFLAITSPGLIRRREAPTTGAEVLRLPNAFDGFEWD